MSNVTVETLLAMIGEREVDKQQLLGQLNQLAQENAQLREDNATMQSLTRQMTRQLNQARQQLGGMDVEPQSSEELVHAGSPSFNAAATPISFPTPAGG